MTPDNTNGVPLIGAPTVWDGVDGLHGEGMKIAIIDTGIDYTHADFGGPGHGGRLRGRPRHRHQRPPTRRCSVRRRPGSRAASTSSATTTTRTTRYSVPQPDPNPLDCNGHGTHVAGTAAGSGVLADGETYAGPYDAETIAGNSWLVGPGVAPEADLYAVRVFGCGGSTDVIVDAIEWAVDNDMDVINMSLGSSFGDADDPSAVAAGQRRQGRRDRRRLGRQLRPEPVHHRLAGLRHQA